MLVDYPLDDNKGQITLIEQFGDDLSIVNDARASFEKESLYLTDKDIKLIHYLIKNKHTSPLRGVVFKFKIKAPLFVCRQFWKHVIASNHNDEQLSWNEKSFRYVSIEDSNEFYIPSNFRLQSKNNKQATEGNLEKALNDKAIAIYQQQCESSYQAYKQLLELGVGREQARGVLVPTVYTTWIWTTSLQAALYFIQLRQENGAQQEIACYAKSIKYFLNLYVPETIKAWEIFS